MTMKLLVLLLLAVANAAATEKTTITGQLRQADESPINSTKIVLNGGEFTTYSKYPDGTFAFYQVPPGVHVLDVLSHQYQFGQVKIQWLRNNSSKTESDDAVQTSAAPKCIEYAYPGAPKQVIVHPLILRAHAKFEYFEKKSGFNPISLLRNPMVLMMIVAFGLMMLMPKMMEGLEPEERAQMQAQMRQQQDPTKMMMSMFGMGDPEPEPSQNKKRKGKRD